MRVVFWGWMYHAPVRCGVHLGCKSRMPWCAFTLEPYLSSSFYMGLRQRKPDAGHSGETMYCGRGRVTQRVCNGRKAKEHTGA